MKNLNFLTSSIRAALVVGVIGGFSATAFAQQDEVSEVEVEQLTEQGSTTETEAEQEIEVVEVTGSRIKANTLEGVTPVTVISADEMIKKGFATAFDALKDLTQNTGATQGAEAGASGGFTPNAQSVSLRGLGNNQVLVLVNGRRVSDYPAPYNGASNFVNLSSIPMAAIARIDILTSGASAIYGSDAVAGVMNIITKKDVEDTTFSAKIGTTTEGGGDEGRFQLVSGISGDDYSVTFAAEYQKQDPIFSADRDFMDSVDDGPAGRTYLDRGIVIVDEMASRGFYPDDEETEDVDESVSWYRDPTERLCQASGSGYEYTDRIINTDDDDDENDFNYGNYCGVDLSGTRTLRNERETTSLYVSSIYDLTDETSIYADVMYSQQDAFVQGGFHFVNAEIIDFVGDGTGNMAVLEEPIYQGDFEGAADYDWRTEQRLFAQHELGFKGSNIEDTGLQVNTGIKGIVFEEYDWELSFSRSESTSDKYSSLLKEEKVAELYLGEHNVHQVWLDQGLEHYDGTGTVDLYAPVTGEIRDELVGMQVTNADSYSNTVSALITGPLAELPAGDMYFALIAEWNKQGYDITLDDRTLNNDGMGWYQNTGTEGNGERERYALGLELQFPILENLSAQVAGRYDQYDDETTDIGGRFSPQVGLEYRPSDSLLVRGNWGKSFRAPDMHRVFATEGGYYSSGADLSTCEDQFYDDQKDDDGDWKDPDNIEKYEPTESPCRSESIKGNSSGSKTLEEEEGTNYGVGFVWDITNSLNLSLDWYNIEIEHLVLGESIQTILSNDFYCKPRQTEDEDGENYYPYEQNDRQDIVPGSKMCGDNASKIVRSDSESTIGLGSTIETVKTSHINAAKQTTEGLDAKVAYHFESELGDWYFNLAWTHTLDSTFQTDEESEEIHTRDLWWNSTARSTMNGSVTWAIEDLSVSFSGRRTGSIPINNPPAEFGDEDSYYYQKVDRLDPWYTFNLTSTYNWSDNVMVRGQVINIFNPKPPKDDTHYSWPYYNGGQYGGASIGRSVYAEMSYTF
ncbi:TonB-dependent receptor [Thalassotalea psychrophila]|uniref:TonB-dependent receptor n=1 Tax=Thalassotalea psychrophila TaxID=3065647 RepID=A0ABY9TZK6_9GAMM|nr:TonB-dependent receptor [Colwelliaceae bacterium SQ149]